MTKHELERLHKRIHQQLDTGSVKLAIELTQSLVSGTQQLVFQTKLDEISNTYHNLLRYFAEGTPDPMRQQIYAKICTQTYEIADRVRHLALLPNSPQIYYETKRTLAIQPIDMLTLVHEVQAKHELKDQNGYELAANQMFNKLWSTDFLSESDTLAVQWALKNEPFPEAAKCQLVSALLMGLQMAFDEAKAGLLFDAADLPSNEVRVRALIGLLLTFYTYQKRIIHYPSLTHRLETTAESVDFVYLLRTIITRFILARETEKVTHRLQEEILPEMMKLAPTMNRWIDRSPESTESLEEGLNPEWQDLLSNSDLSKKIEEYNRLQEEGVDVMHSTFIHLKHFPFFRQLGNWFLPFDLHHSLFANQPLIKNDTLQEIIETSFMCNSDKYSLCHSLMQVPESYRQAMIGQFESQLSQANVQKKADLHTRHTHIETIAGQYIQDLYRFYKLYPRKSDFEDIFDSTLDFHNQPELKPYLCDLETQAHIAEFYLRKGYFENAQELFEAMLATQSTDNSLCQKIGYCQQMNGNTAAALQSYLRAELLQPDSPWLLRRLAACYRAQKEPNKALPYYLRYEQLCPNQVSHTVQTGHCYLELKSYNEALNCYFKADYLEPGNPKHWRPIAWCSFVSRKYEQAHSYYQRIIESDPQAVDYLNAGHTAWALNEVKKALGLYRLAVDKKDFTNFLALFHEDEPHLLNAGIAPNEVALLLDQLQYTLQ